MYDNAPDGYVLDAAAIDIMKTAFPPKQWDRVPNERVFSKNYRDQTRMTPPRYCNAKPYKKTYTNPTFHDLRSFPSAPLLNFRIQVTFLYHKGVCIELVLLIHVKIRKFGHFPLENEGCSPGQQWNDEHPKVRPGFFGTLGLNPLYPGMIHPFPQARIWARTRHVFAHHVLSELSVLWVCGRQIDFKNQIEPFETVQELKSNYSIAATFLSKWFSISSKHIE